MQQAEVIIVGGGPAGSSCAARLKHHNIDCLILDRADFPREKLCAGWITPEVLDDLGVHSSEYPHGIIPLRKLHINIRGLRFGVPTLQYSIRRYEFDNWLLRRSGVEVVTHNVAQVERKYDQFIIDDTYSCRYVIGAGGTGCPVYKSFFRNAGIRRNEHLIVTQEKEFQYRYTDPRCYLWFMENKLPGYAWYVPKENGYLNIGVGGKERELRKQNDSIKGHWTLLMEKLKARNLITASHIKPEGHSYYLRSGNGSIRSGNAFLIGDAAGLATVDMGEGIGPAVRSGINAADAIAYNREYTLEGIPRRSIRWKWLRFRNLFRA